MMRKYHNHTLQTNPQHREEEPQNNNECLWVLRIINILLDRRNSFVVWPMVFSLIFADVKIGHPRITTKEALKTYSNFQF